MKTVSKHQQEDNREIGQLIRRLFELQLELEEINSQPNDYNLAFQRVTESLDDLFNEVMHQSLNVH